MREACSQHDVESPGIFVCDDVTKIENQLLGLFPEAIVWRHILDISPGDAIPRRLGCRRPKYFRIPQVQDCQSVKLPASGSNRKIHVDRIEITSGWHVAPYTLH